MTALLVGIIALVAGVAIGAGFAVGYLMGERNSLLALLHRRQAEAERRQRDDGD